VGHLVQTTLWAQSGWTATPPGRACRHELGRGRDGRPELNDAIYHDRYQRTGDGWTFTERVCEVRYHDTTSLAGPAPRAAGGAR
jgi:hypothetical protein